MHAGDLRDVLSGPAITHPDSLVRYGDEGAVVDIVDISAHDTEGYLVALLLGDDTKSLTVADLFAQLEDTPPMRQIVAEADNSIISGSIIVDGHTVTLLPEE